MGRMFWRLRRNMSNFLLYAILCTLGIVFTSEYLLYYITLWRCNWPHINTKDHKEKAELGIEDVSQLKLLVLSDPHLLGERNGHWLDKLRREWQMYRSYQTALQLFDPTAVFILGDIFDEGKWATSMQWDKYVKRAGEVFATPNHIAFHVIVGNHDVGFHHHVTENKLTRFFQDFDTGNVQVVKLRGNMFILLNSMGFDEDGCFMCKNLQNRLKEVAKDITCSQNEDSDECLPKYNNVRPIVMQHFPLYRKSDESCDEVDSVPKDEVKPFVPKHDTLTKEASQQILQLFKPRLILSGHTHDACTFRHSQRTLEISVPSFSWRNRENPSFLLVTVTNDDFATSKCFLPRESTIIYIYASLPFLIICIIFKLFKPMKIA